MRKVKKIVRLIWGVEEQLGISSSCFSPGRVKKLQKFINVCLKVGHSAITFQVLMKATRPMIITSKALGTLHAQHFIWERSINYIDQLYRATSIITKCVYMWVTHAYRSAHNSSFLTLRVIQLVVYYQRCVLIGWATTRIGCVPFGESKNGFLILNLPDFAVERNVKSEIGFVTLVTFRQRVQYARQPLKKWRVFYCLTNYAIIPCRI